MVDGVVQNLLNDVYMSCGCFFFFFFFFSSRRRHTRYWRDWSSDVCSSDLTIFYTGCGPTAMAMVAATLGNIPGVNPSNMADFFTSHGWATPDGTSWQRSEERRVGKECRSRWARQA